MSQAYHIRMGPTAYITDTTCLTTVLLGTTRFRIKVELAQVKGTSFGTEILQQLEIWKGLPWGKARNEPISDLIYQHCLPLLERLAPQTSLQDLSLESFLHSPTYNLELVRGGSAEDIRIQGADACLYTPAFFTSPMRTADLPSACTAVPHFQARDISIAPTLAESQTVSAIQGRVVTAARRALYFKPRLSLREPEFERELRILSRITDTGLAARLRVPTLHGIVVSNEYTIGMLMTLITSSKAGTHLRSPGLQGRSEMHGKWEEQLTEIIRELHAHGIVWGDVHPMNVVIDEAMDAWAVDFGGMNNVEFVDDGKRETVEGDWQGIKRIFRDWLPDPLRRSRW
jgi:tRNA A-37 threonylcarbamoyl transferase component Bud32